MPDHRLLILDDDPLIGETIGHIARSIGLEVRATTEARTFFETLDEWQPGQIALDLVMPDMDGVEVLVELARRQCQAGIIITSGVGSRVLDAAGRSAAEHGLNIVGVLSKPFATRELKSMLVTPGEPAAPARRPAETAAQDGEITAEELEQAIEHGELGLVYQPKIACQSGQLAGFEALVRWHSPVRGMVAPDCFVPLAERCGLMIRMTGVILDMALGWFSRARHSLSTADDATGPLITLSINLSARSMDDERFVDRVSGQCRELGIPPEELIFELTETSAMEDPVASLDMLTRIRMKGFQLSIDDFGTGYSSMLQLVRLPFSEIKIDKSFVASATSSEESRAVTRSIVELGHSLGLRATAEGVEDAATLAFLAEIGCDLAQGYYISRPIPASEAEAWARHRQKKG